MPRPLRRAQVERAACAVVSLSVLALACACTSSGGTGNDDGHGSAGHGGGATSATGGAGGAGGSSEADVPARYPLGRTQSPITESVAQNLRAIAARGPTLHDDVFAKVGDSITAEPSSFMTCFAGSAVELDGRTELAPTIVLFKAGDAAGTTPYERDSLAAVIGKTAHWAVTGAPSPLEQETSALAPRYALIMFGTNDVEGGGTYLHTYAASLFAIVDPLIAAGTIPILSTIPPRDDDPAVDVNVVRYDEVVRGVAQGRQIPYVDFHRELLPLPAHGLGADGVHPNTYFNGSYRPCSFTADALAFGFNVRNLVSMQALTRVLAAVQGAPAPDAAMLGLAGSGTPADPWLIDALPFVDLADTSTSQSASLDSYACDPTKNEGGPEVAYRLVVGAATPLRATVFVHGTVDVDLQLLDGAHACLQRHDKELFFPSLAPGTYDLIVDSFVPADGVARAGEYLLSVLTE